MHLYFPLQAKYSFAEVKAFAHLLAQKVHARLPKLTSLERMPKERRYQIYLDFLQNAISQTIAAPYCVRPKPGATVSAPLAWPEVKKGLHPTQFTINNMPARLKKKAIYFRSSQRTGWTNRSMRSWMRSIVLRNLFVMAADFFCAFKRLTCTCQGRSPHD